jgi:hypothetical protein
MDVVPNRIWTASALILIIVVSLIMALSGSLDGAAAWANIIALPVAIIGAYLALRDSGRTSDLQDQSQADGRAASGSGAAAVSQVGYTANGDVIQVAGDYNVRGRPDSDGR